MLEKLSAANATLDGPRPGPAQHPNSSWGSRHATRLGAVSRVGPLLSAPHPLARSRVQLT